MSTRLTSGDRRLLLAGGGLLALMIAITVLFAGNGAGERDDPSSWSSASGGTKAAFLLLQSLGYDVDRWQQPPDALTDAARTTLILAEPQSPEPNDIAAIRRFLDAGGRVIATGSMGGTFLEVLPMPELFPGRLLRTAPASSGSSFAAAAPQIQLIPFGYWPPSASGTPLYTVSREGIPDGAVVVELSPSHRQTYWWSSPTPITNFGITADHNLAFVLSSIGPKTGRRVLFDEYFHGARPTLAGFVWKSPIKWVFAQIALFVVLMVLAYSRRSGPIVLPAPDRRLAPLEFVSTLGSLYRRAGAASIAVDVAAKRWRGRLTRKLGLPVAAPIERLQDAAGRRWDNRGIEAVQALAACEGGRSESMEDARALTLVTALDNAGRQLGVWPTLSKEQS